MKNLPCATGIIILATSAFAFAPSASIPKRTTPLRERAARAVTSHPFPSVPGASVSRRPFTRLFEGETDVEGSTAMPDAEEEPLDTPILSRDVLPELPKEAILDVYYAEQAIQALGLIGEVVEGYHTGIVFELRDKSRAKEWGVPPEFTVEWYALQFPFGAFLPNVADVTDSNPAGLEWDNRSHPHYSPRYDPSRWTKARTLVGYLDGEAFGEYARWVVEYDANSPGYQAFEVWDRPQLIPYTTRRWVESETCATFAELSLRKMWSLGGKSDTPKQILERSYVPIIAKRKPTAVDLSDPEQAKEVRDFYVELNKAARGVDGEGLTTSQFIRLLADRLEVFFAYNTVKDAYTRVELAPPYFALANLYQPMSLPWQLADLTGDGNLVDPGAFAPEESEEDVLLETGTFTEELSSAAGSVGGLLKKRVPAVAKKKLGPKLTFVLPVAAAVILGASAYGAKDGIINESLVIGVLIGFVLGKVTSSDESESE